MYGAGQLQLVVRRCAQRWEYRCGRNWKFLNLLRPNPFGFCLRGWVFCWALASAAAYWGCKRRWGSMLRVAYSIARGRGTAVPV